MPMDQPSPMTARRNGPARSGSTEQSTSRRGLHARCVACGATASDWRHLLGVGASVVPSSADAESVLLTYPRACGKCGASELLVEVASDDRGAKATALSGSARG
jgi:hypothetical protein